MSSEDQSRRGRSSRGSRRHSEEHSPGSSADRWMISYADLLTLLFALFVVLYTAYDKEMAHRVQYAVAAQFDNKVRVLPATGGTGVLPGERQLVAIQSKIEEAFSKSENMRKSTRLTKNERGLVVSLAEAGFFESGEASIRSDGLAIIDKLAQSILESEALVRIEGHTDSQPIATSRYPSNWELSAARASAVLAHLVLKGINPSRLSVAGFAGERPVADNTTPEGRALNRRVDLVILGSN
jgi:chemotaxis protein MotB